VIRYASSWEEAVKRKILLQKRNISTPASYTGYNLIVHFLQDILIWHLSWLYVTKEKINKPDSIHCKNQVICTTCLPFVTFPNGKQLLFLPQRKCGV
jgi:hypothetical protein